MCEFVLDLNEMVEGFGPSAKSLAPYLDVITTRFAPFVRKVGQRLEITAEGRPLTRMIASVLDLHVPEGVRYSRAS